MVLDSVDFENEDIIITDPGYVVKIDDWDICIDSYYSDDSRDITYGLKKLGFTKVISYRIFRYIKEEHQRFRVDSKEKKLGEFSVGTRFFAVFSLDEVKRYNPNYNYKIERDCGCAVIIKDFTGHVSIEPFGSRETIIVGHGNINFNSEIME